MVEIIGQKLVSTVITCKASDSDEICGHWFPRYWAQSSGPDDHAVHMNSIDLFSFDLWGQKFSRSRSSQHRCSMRATTISLKKTKFNKLYRNYSLQARPLRWIINMPTSPENQNINVQIWFLQSSAYGQDLNLAFNIFNDGGHRTITLLHNRLLSPMLEGPPWKLEA